MNDIIDSPATICIRILVDDVILDCQNYEVDGIDTTATRGIDGRWRNNITIDNCRVRDWDFGITIANNSLVKNSEAVSNTHTGIGIMTDGVNSTISNSVAKFNVRGFLIGMRGSNNTITDNIAHNNTYGIFIANLTSNITIKNNWVYNNTDGLKAPAPIGAGAVIKYFEIFNNTIEFNTYGIDFYNGSSFISFYNNTIRKNFYGIYLNRKAVNWTIYDNYIIYNDGGGIIECCGVVDPAVDNKIYNNLFNNSITIPPLTPPLPNYWNTTKTLATNIVGGPYIGGNYWGMPDLTGYSDICTHIGDGFCDPYVLNPNNTDYLPLTIIPVVPPYIAVTFSYDVINFGTLNVNTLNPAPNQYNGVYNVTIDTNASYQVKAYGLHFSGPETLPISNLYFDTNTTAGNLAYTQAISLSTTPQLIDSYAQDVTLNYHGFWLYVPKVLYGYYNTTISVIYETV